MKRLFFVLSLLAVTLSSKAQSIPACTADDIIHRASSKDTVYIINFWATWCAPCVAELPEFNKLKEYYAGKPVKVVLVSLDFKEDYPYKLQGFIDRKKLAPEVWWLSETDPNIFIPKIDNSWQGSIPATIIVAPGKQFKKFIEGTISKEQVSRIANAQL